MKMKRVHGLILGFRAQIHQSPQLGTANAGFGSKMRRNDTQFGTARLLQCGRQRIPGATPRGEQRPNSGTAAKCQQHSGPMIASNHWPRTSLRAPAWGERFCYAATLAIRRASIPSSACHNAWAAPAPAANAFSARSGCASSPWRSCCLQTWEWYTSAVVCKAK